MRKICIITGSRAEYGLLYWTMKRIQQDADLQLQLCATGMHLSPEFGLTYKEIEKDGFFIDEKIETQLSSDTSIGISKSIGLGIISFCEAFERLKPDIILVLGDRYEIFASVSAALISKIPVAHCHGGETTEGAYDEGIRHSITKMSHIHFCSTEVYKNRIIQLGENPLHVFNVGALGIENILKLNLLDKADFEKSIDFKLGKLNFMVTFHPVTLENFTAESQFQELLDALHFFKESKIIFTKPNADNDGRIICKMIDKYVAENPNQCISFISLGQLRYLSALKHVDIIIGNSSSGIIEVPSFHKPTINIGDRQKGRIQSNSTFNCNPNKEEIIDLVNQVLRIEKIDAKNPYYKEDTSIMIKNKLKDIDISTIIKKHFYDISF
jgi:GDP/UDP-N,N'-diacetylbacillosamine 2-epimerase (hydrolysing)